MRLKVQTCGDCSGGVSPFCYPVASAMKQSHPHGLIFLLATACLIGCGAPGIPLPPSLEFAKNRSPISAPARKADRVTLSWATPAETTDGQTVRRLSPVQICRSIDTVIKNAGRRPESFSVSSPATHFRPGKAGPGKKVSPTATVQAHYVDTISPDLQNENPTGQITYALVIPNEKGRSAGLSNQVQVPSAPTLPPPARLQNPSHGRWDCACRVAKSRSRR